MRELILKTDIKNKLSKCGFHLSDEFGVWIPQTLTSFGYNDGDDAENYILNVVTNASDLSVDSDELAEKMIDWPSIYHLSPRRSNLLRPFANQFKGKRILEIGCGCGAISRFLGESGAEVISVEGSLRRASIARQRCRDLDNVTIISNPSDKLPDLGEFDFVLLIGVLEYARMFLGKGGENTLLADCYARLKTKGKLFVAIENKIGIKYLAGAHEDHVNQPMFGVNNSYTEESVVTFGRHELIDVLQNAGFKGVEEFLPLPDYKLPSSVITPRGWQNYQHELCQLAVESIHKDSQLAFQHIFSVEQGIKNVWNNNLAADLSNSFLMLASKENVAVSLNKTAAIYYSDSRLAEFNKTIEFVSEPDGKLHVVTRHKKGTKIQSNTEFHYGSSLWMELTSLVNHPDWNIEQLGCWANNWIKQLSIKADLPESFDKNALLPASFQDALPFNIIDSENSKFQFFDLEWVNDSKPVLGYIAFRGIFHSLLRVTSFSFSNQCTTRNISSLTFDIMKKIGLNCDENDFESYLKQEADFLSRVQHENQEKIYNSLKELTIVVRAQNLVGIDIVQQQQKAIDTLNQQLQEMTADNENASGELVLEIYHLRQQKDKLSGELNQLRQETAQLVQGRDELLQQNVAQTALINQYINDMNQVLNSFSWRISSPLRVLGRRIPSSVRMPVKKLAMHSFSLLQPLKVKSGQAARKIKLSAKQNGLKNTVERVVRRSARSCYYRLPIRYRNFALRAGMKVFPHWFNHHPAWQQPFVGGHAMGPIEPVFINYRSNSGYQLSSVPDEYVYIPAQKPHYFDDIVSQLAIQPKFSIIVPIYNTPLELLYLMVQSVKNQWYGNWELVLANDASPQPEVLPALKKLAAEDDRIIIVNMPENKGIAGATNVAIENAQGEYMVLLDHDDELTDDCLFELLKTVNSEDPDFIYSDEDKITPEGKFAEPHFKPDWSPDTMMSTMYTCHVACVRMALVRQLGGLRTEFDGCQDWDFVLRLTELTTKISHIAKVLYHWRVIPASIASDITAKPYVLAASQAVRAEAMARRGVAGEVEALPGYHGYFRVNYKPQNNPLISVIIPTRDNKSVLARCIDSIQADTAYQNYEIIIVDNGSKDADTLALLQRYTTYDRIKVVRHDKPFNFSELNNVGVAQSSGEILLFLNDDTEVLHADWLERMAGYAQQKHVGAVGAKLVYADKKSVQHSGVLNLQNGPSHAFLRQHKDHPGYFLRNQLEYNWLIVTGACMMIERKKYEQVGGFDETFPIAYNDVDLCMQLSHSGFYNVMCQSVCLIHHESISRGIDHMDEVKAKRLKEELNRLNIKHPYYYQFDPYFNRNLAANGYNFEIMK